MSLAKRGVLVFDLWCGNKTDGWDTLPDSRALTVFKCDQCDNTFKSRNLYSVSHHSWACTLLFLVANLIYSGHVLYTFTLYCCVIVLFCIPFRLTPQKSGMNIQSNCVAKMHQLHPSQLSPGARYQMQLESRAIKPPPQMTLDQMINFIPITNFLPSIQYDSNHKYF